VAEAGVEEDSSGIALLEEARPGRRVVLEEGDCPAAGPGSQGIGLVARLDVGQCDLEHGG
jgi:hypothetical protein